MIRLPLPSTATIINAKGYLSCSSLSGSNACCVTATEAAATVRQKPLGTQPAMVRLEQVPQW